MTKRRYAVIEGRGRGGGGGTLGNKTCTVSIDCEICKLFVVTSNIHECLQIV